MTQVPGEPPPGHQVDFTVAVFIVELGQTCMSRQGISRGHRQPRVCVAAAKGAATEGRGQPETKRSSCQMSFY